MKTLTSIISLCVLITFVSVNSNTNENIKLIENVLGNANSYWIVKPEDAHLTASYRSNSSNSSSSGSEDISLNTTELATKYGYEVQVHTLTTEDRYILTLIRIVGEGPVVFLMHGFIGSSDDYVVSGPGIALAYLLADAGYDVWLGNARGNKYSRDHEFLDPDSRAFWQFCWHDIGVTDLPTMVDHALVVSKTDKLTYIGHSQGTTVFFVLTSEKPEYNEKFNLMISLGTIAWTWHIKIPAFQALVSISDTQLEFLENLGLYEIFSASPVNKFVHSKLCCLSRVALLSCLTALFDVGGYDYDQIDYKNACVKLAHIPSGASMRQLRHFVQLARSRQFAPFDFGRVRNLLTYRSPSPPPYNVERITTPIAVFHGDNDLVSCYDDMQTLVLRLPNVLTVNRIPYSSFNHYDFIWAKDAERLLYRDIFKIIAENVPGGGECGKNGGDHKICKIKSNNKPYEND